MAVRAKFFVATITKHASGLPHGRTPEGWSTPIPVGEVIMRPVTRGEENAEWASATPAGEFKMTIRGEALPWFEERLAREVSILITDVSETGDSEPGSQ